MNGALGRTAAETFARGSDFATGKSVFGFTCCQADIDGELIFVEPGAVIDGVAGSACSPFRLNDPGAGVAAGTRSIVGTDEDHSSVTIHSPDAGGEYDCGGSTTGGGANTGPVE